MRCIEVVAQFPVFFRFLLRRRVMFRSEVAQKPLHVRGQRRQVEGVNAHLSRFIALAELLRAESKSVLHLLVVRFQPVLLRFFCLVPQIAHAPVLRPLRRHHVCGNQILIQAFHDRLVPRLSHRQCHEVLPQTAEHLVAQVCRAFLHVAEHEVLLHDFLLRLQIQIFPGKILDLLFPVSHGLLHVVSHSAALQDELHPLLVHSNGRQSKRKLLFVLLKQLQKLTAGPTRLDRPPSCRRGNVTASAKTDEAARTARWGNLWVGGAVSALRTAWDVRQLAGFVLVLCVFR
mmetsp:Transcript_7384/g.17752  ORF Transcript_7384/g.17752 Transcript_7384/m.17752 type:complete len:288 (+) Transcript_7384:13582-14445(+)